LFNRKKNKVFFFVSQEFLGQRSNPTTGYANVPNANQRAGDFSYYPNSTGNFIANSLRNPVTGAYFTPWAGTSGGAYGGQQNFAQYAGNFNAQSQKWGQAMMADLPLPNLCNAASGTSDTKPWNGIAAGVQGSNLISPGNCPSSITSQTTGLATGNIDAQGGPGTTNNNTRNYYYIYNGTIARRDDVVRMDFNFTSKLTAYARFGHDHFNDSSAGSIPLKSTTNGLFSPTFEPHPNPGKGWAIGVTYTLTPTLVNQLTLGYSWNDYAYDLDPTKLDRANMLNPPSFHNFGTDPLYNQGAVARPELVPGQLYFSQGIPSANFGGSSWSETGVGQPFCNGTCPNFNFNPMYSVGDTLSKTIGAHNFKAGVYWEWNQKVETANSNSQGTYNFTGGNTLMQQDTLDGYANAYLGNIQQYTESQRVLGFKSSQALEAFVEDSWRVSRRFTLDLGVRFSHLPAMQDAGQNMVEFVPSSYSASAAERIFYPYCTVSTATTPCTNAAGAAVHLYSWDKAQNPSGAVGTGNGGPGNMYPAYLAAGTLVPVTAFINGVSVATGGYSGATNPYTGMQISTTSNTVLPFQQGIYQVPRFQPAPRIGFAWDVFGNGKTAIRGGFGENLRREPNSNLNGQIGATPDSLPLTQYFGNVASVATNPLAGYVQSALPAANGVIGLSPLGPQSMIGNQKYEASYNGSFEIQQNVGFSTVVQAAYVFTDVRHSGLTQSINNVTTLGTPIGLGALWNNFAPAALDPTKVYLDATLPGNASGRNLNDNYFRTTYPGFGAVSQYNYAGSSDYSSLQASVRRNFTKRISYSVAYTWSKTMSLSGRSALFTDKFRNWGPSYSPTPQFVTFTYVYQVPGIAQKLGFKPLKWVTDDWEWSGVTQIRGDIRTGVPTISYANSNATSNPTPNMTGTSLEGQRMNIIGNINLPASQVSFLGGPTNVNIGVNGTPGNALLNNAALAIPNACSLTANANPVLGVGENMSCFGNAGAGSLVTIPGTRVNDWDMTFRKRFPLKSEKRTLEFRAEMYNIWNHTQFIGYATGQSYDWSNYKNGVLVPTNGSTGRYNNTVNPRLMSFALRFQF
jgi:hypothetical protein